jgi:hypothetical protein
MSEKTEMVKVLKRFRGASTWICGTLKISKPALSHWAHGRMNSAILDLAVPPLLKRIERSNGACMFPPDVDGKSVREHVTKGRTRKAGSK